MIKISVTEDWLRKLCPMLSSDEAYVCYSYADGSIVLFCDEESCLPVADVPEQFSKNTIIKKLFFESEEVSKANVLWVYWSVERDIPDAIWMTEIVKLSDILVDVINGDTGRLLSDIVRERKLAS